MVSHNRDRVCRNSYRENDIDSQKIRNVIQWDTSLNLLNSKLLIDEEDVYVTLGLPMGQLEIGEGQSSQTDIEWNIERGGPPIGSMHKVILECGGHGHEFITDLLAYAISTCIVRNANGTCHFRILKYLHNVNEIYNYNWCVYVINCLNDAVSEWKGDKSTFFMGLLLFLMVTAFDQPISLIAQFRSKKVERWFLVAINWPTKLVRKRDRDEQLPGEYRRGRIIERIDYHIVARLAEANLEGGSGELSTITAIREQRCPYCSHYNGQLQDVVPVTSDPVQITHITTAQSFWNRLTS
ncbi:hypothetical protein Cgig2_002678 [Carnegiea gigantea]|uniref:Aminotransferase-like plant mobile domain-containing protein n=1 Tax=Carnegiea gigantea TaxID=171969 RepID=A0A9Q1QBV3_9CARY|nr:hypothetical protein Cgig2_002678 [Carnegiea gigantea]